MGNVKMLTRKKAIQQEISKKKEQIRELEHKLFVMKENCDHSIMVIECKEIINKRTTNLCSRCLFCDYQYESYHSLVPADVRSKLDKAIFIDATNTIIEEVEEKYIRLKQENKYATNQKIAKIIQDELDSK